MKKTIWIYSLFLLIFSLGNHPFIKGQALNLSPQSTARELVKKAVLLAESDKPLASVATLKKALAISPNYLRAHIDYRNIKANFLDQYDEVEAEYQALIKRFPNNPVYLMATYLDSDIEVGIVPFRKVINLAPQWAWSHYAKALLVQESDPEKAVIELQHCIEKDSSAIEAYELLIYLQEKRLKRIDDAIRTAESLARQAGIRANLRLQPLWRLRLAKSQRSEEAKETLKNELSQLANSTKKVDVLLAIRSAYLNLIKDHERARSIENRIVKIDPSWNINRGWLFRGSVSNQSGVPRPIVLANRQIDIHEKTQGIVNSIDIDTSEKIKRLEELLRLNPIAAMKRIIYEKIFQQALRSGDADIVRKYGKALYLIDPDDSALLSRMALLLTDKSKYTTEALYFARKAESLTSAFKPAKRSLNTPTSFLKESFPEQKQREAYRRNRALSLDALGWVLTKINRVEEAESLLSKAVEIERSESSLWHLAKALEKLGRINESKAVETEANTFLANSVKRKFINEQIGDVQLESIDGRSFKLSNLKGKVVVINFWATWCIPCIKEMPSLKKLYEKYKDKGFELLAVSIDDDPGKVAPFARKYNFNFPVFNNLALKNKFGKGAIPENLFIDKQGNIKYRTIGYEAGEEREYEAVILELLK
jgi:thiol-disulfide isomerase/thioredoxin